MWDRFENAVEEVGIGGGRNCMSLLTIQEGSENMDNGAEV